MTAWTDKTVRAALGAGGGDERIRFTSVSTDSRSLEPGSLFVALVGERLDGHDYLAAAKAAGATAAVVRESTADVPGLRLYRVADPLASYALLARARRRRVPGPVVAVTGTNGKTSTKEMLAAALRTRYRTHATRLNLNNLVGVPQTILAAPADVQAMVIEAGANRPGEIASHRATIEPDLTVITNVAAGHLEGFGSLEGVMREKLELARGVPFAVVGTEPSDLARRAREVAGAVVSAGLSGADVLPARVEIGADGRATLTADGQRIELRLLGRHQAANAMLVWAAARHLGLVADEVARALGEVTIPGGRAGLESHGGLTVLNDCYNANPASFRAAIELASAIRGDRRLVFVAGTMRELGAESAARHAEIALALVGLEPDLLAAVGDFGPALERHRARLGGRLMVAPDAEAMGRLLAPRLAGDELVVLKGSRGVALERMLPLLASRTVHRD